MPVSFHKPSTLMDNITLSINTILQSIYLNIQIYKRVTEKKKVKKLVLVKVCDIIN